ncbi:hypothetical protein [Lactobacillus xylocopicola]|uniref:Phage protein n=1 Tax=Lactobacillus xylocopicola TaxID=2976676 RepID=A0ABN6SPH1_9LACO|nr:hypothetical protein [Lactobacillus xylocopicola]BDR60917.1 hypothetical protein KIM322_11780 [Lactobacillus xylocopicola]
MIIKRKDWNNYLNKDILIEKFGKSQSNGTFTLGYMVADLGQYYIFQIIDDNGTLLVYTLCKKTNIERLECEDNYTKMFDFYIAYQKKHNNFDPLNLEKIYQEMPKQSINAILKYCYDNGFYVSITDEKSDLYKTGRVVSVDEQKVMIDEESYCKDYEFDTTDEISKEPTNINDILTLEFVAQDNYLYEQYLKQK